jgi:hypothetical protein
MADNSMMRRAQAIADRYAEAMSGDDASAASFSETIAAYHDHCREAQHQYNARELTLFEAEPDRIGRLFDLLVAGNYRETAARIVGITDRAIRMWMQKADEGVPRYQAFADVVRAAEAIAESSAVRNVRAAGKQPQFWAVEMTYLERKYPDRWGRRQEDQNVPKVIVQIGIKDSDVQIGVIPPRVAGTGDGIS